MTQINGPTTTAGGPGPKAPPAAPTPGAPAPTIAADGRQEGSAPPTDVARALKLLRGLELPTRPKIMFRDATRDAWVRDAAHTLVRAQKVLDILREAALDPRTPVSPADWQAARAKVQALGAAVAAHDKNQVRGEAFAAMLAPHKEVLQEAGRFGEPPAEPEAYAKWRERGQALLDRAEQAIATMCTIGEDTGIDPFQTRLMNGEVAPGPGPEVYLRRLERQLGEPMPGKLDGLRGFIRNVAAVAEAVEIAPNGQLRERRR